MKETDKSRRRFLRNAGVLALAGMAGVSCLRDNDEKSTPEVMKGEGEMTYRINHNTGDRVSILGFGCMRLPTEGMTGVREGSDEIDQAAVDRQVDYALAHGVNYFDTSPAYCQGKSEQVMGKSLSRHPRESYFIATKLSNFAESQFSTEASQEMFENSLKYLQTDYVDYLLLHSVGGGGMERFSRRYLDNGIMYWLAEQKEKGRIRNLGFSYHGDVAVFDYLLELMDRGEIHWDFVQIQLNYLDWKHAREMNESNTDAEYLYGELHKRNIPVVIMEPLLGGRLAQVSAPIQAKMKQKRPDDSVASWAFRYAGTPEDVLTVLSGMTYMEHLQENVETYSPLDPVTDEENEFLERMALEILANNTVPCNDCKYCMPCPYGVDIPGVFVHYNKCIIDDNAPRDTRDPRYDAARRAYLVSYDRAVEPGRQADRCITCGSCLSHCPQSINIPEKLREIADYTDRLKANKA